MDNNYRQLDGRVLEFGRPVDFAAARKFAAPARRRRLRGAIAA
jgi:hypothetical protein